MIAARMAFPLLALAASALVAGCGEIKADFSHDDDPTITALSPARGGADGGAMITITGSGFSGDVQVVVDGIAATTATVSSPSEIVFELPPGTEGHIVDVAVSTDHGFGVAEDAFTYNPRPVVLDISPKVGRAAGGTNVTITGRGFQDLDAGVPTITIGGAPATNVQIVNDTTVTATTAPAAPNSVAFTPLEISLRNANGERVIPEVFTLTAQGLLATTRQQVYWINPTTKAFVQISQLPRAIGACALSPNGQLFARSRAPGTGQHELVTFDPFARTVTSVGTLLEAGINHSMGSMVFVGNGLFGIDGSSNPTKKLFSIDQTTGALTAIGAPLNLGRHASIAAKDGGTVFHVFTTNATLNSISTTTGAIVGGPALTGGGLNRRGHGMTVIGSTLYVSEDSSPGAIYTVDQVTGVMTDVVTIPATINSLCKTPPSF